MSYETVGTISTFEDAKKIFDSIPALNAAELDNFKKWLSSDLSKVSDSDKAMITRVSRESKLRVSQLKDIDKWLSTRKNKIEYLSDDKNDDRIYDETFLGVKNKKINYEELTDVLDQLIIALPKSEEELLEIFRNKTRVEQEKDIVNSFARIKHLEGEVARLTPLEQTIEELGKKVAELTKKLESSPKTEPTGLVTPGSQPTADEDTSTNSTAGEPKQFITQAEAIIQTPETETTVVQNALVEAASKLVAEIGLYPRPNALSDQESPLQKARRMATEFAQVRNTLPFFQALGGLDHYFSLSDFQSVIREEDFNDRPQSEKVPFVLVAKIFLENHKEFQLTDRSRKYLGEVDEDEQVGRIREAKKKISDANGIRQMIEEYAPLIIRQGLIELVPVDQKVKTNIKGHGNENKQQTVKTTEPVKQTEVSTNPAVTTKPEAPVVNEDKQKQLNELLANLGYSKEDMEKAREPFSSQVNMLALAVATPRSLEDLANKSKKDIALGLLKRGKDEDIQLVSNYVQKIKELKG